jgi:hypothetical protein
VPDVARQGAGRRALTRWDVGGVGGWIWHLCVSSTESGGLAEDTRCVYGRIEVQKTPVVATVSSDVGLASALIDCLSGKTGLRVALTVKVS